jgi:hypothetical protein
MYLIKHSIIISLAKYCNSSKVLFLVSQSTIISEAK